MTKQLPIIDLLRLNLADSWQRVHRERIQQLADAYKDWSLAENRFESVTAEHWELVQLIKYIQFRLGSSFQRIVHYKNALQTFKHNYHAASAAEERLQHALTAANEIGYSSYAIKRIARGKAKWFDEAAVSDRFDKVIATKEQDMLFLIERQCSLTSHLLQQIPESVHQSTWRLIDLPENLTESLRYTQQQKIQSAAARGLRFVAERVPESLRYALPNELINFLYRLCLDRDNNSWLRAEAMSVLAITNHQQFDQLMLRLVQPGESGDIFLVGRLAETLLKHQFDHPKFAELIELLLNHPSEFVRQRVAEHYVYLPDNKIVPLIAKLFNQEFSERVKAQAFLSLLLPNCPKLIRRQALHLMVKNLRTEQPEFLLRTLLYLVPQFLELSRENQKLGEQVQQLEQVLTELHCNHASTPVRRWAAEAREALWVFSNQTSEQFEQQLHQLTQLPLEARQRVKLDKEPDESIYRKLAYYGRQRHGLNIQSTKKGLKVIAGFRFGFRLWRLIFEYVNPATDKRQNHNHLKGRIYRGLHQCNTRAMAEQSMTKVPGEPYFFNDESGERAFLPLVDQLISSLDQGWPTKPLLVYSSEGITEIVPPRGLFSRLRARVALQLEFAEFARLRNWEASATFAENAFVTKLSKLGFQISIRGYGSLDGTPYPVEPRVQRFFSAWSIPIAIPSITDAQNYFYSVYQNTITQLLAFTALFTGGVIAHHIQKIVQLRRARNQIPLVIGGWGTRGKSGTERLKAALFNELGLSVLSKTTGCEAMFLYGNPNRPMKELFLFRPYDKATIWEQVFLTQFSANIKADVFLWECMGLTPRYIGILQNQWMRDDISTITNCYPDHEDLQGPAGIEIPIVMQNFIGNKGQIFTTEESMLPLLQDEAQRKQANLVSVTWLQSGLICSDILERFPYAEHPNNIALVQTMAQSLGVRSDVALKAMAENVVADLGVLKIYPKVSVRQRNLQFINGMSANERLGALGNWQRTGLAAHHLTKDPEIWTAVVVNNRADRIARSQVFARMLINDMQADRYFFIGNNLDGLQNYIQNAWDEYVEDFIPAKEDDKLKQQFSEVCQRFRIPTDTKIATNRSCVAINGLDSLAQVATALNENLAKAISLDEVNQQLADSMSSLASTELDSATKQAIDACFAQITQDYEEAFQWQQQLTELGRAENQQWIKDTFTWLFKRIKSRYVIVEDYYSTGNQTLNLIVQHTPPGLDCRMIGVQNIKGTGLDFIYRWQAWDQVYKHAETIRTSRFIADIEQATQALASWQDFGILEEQYLEQAINEGKQRQICQQESIQADLAVILQNMQYQLKAIHGSLDSSDTNSSSWWLKLLTVVEAFLDSGDAVKRRKKSNEIYRDLIENLISTDKATLELAKLNKAQKGGWLVSAFKERLANRSS